MISDAARSALALFAFCFPLSLASVALAEPKDDMDSQDSSADENKADDDKDKGEGDKDKGDGDKDASDPTKAPTYESPGKRYYFLGARFRDVIVPKFILNIFADGGRTVNVPMGGLEGSFRKDRLDIGFALSYADYSMDPFLFKGKKDGEEAWERVESSLKIIYGTFDILYDIPLDKKGMFSIMIGGGVGFGGVIGELKRVQIYPGQPGADPDDPKQWEDCVAAGNPDAFYCDGSNGHYGDYAEPSWANGGSKPFIFPWISIPQISFRVKPHQHVYARVDLGFAVTSGFYFGAGAGYGF